MKHKHIKSIQYLKPIVASTLALGLMTGSAWAAGTSSDTETTTGDMGSAGAEQSSQTGAHALGSSTGSQASMQKSELYNKTADEVIGMEVVQSQDEKKIGEVENIVKDNSDDSLKAVIAVDQILGLVGGKQIAISVDELELKNEQLVIDTSEESLKQRAEYNEANYTPLDHKDRPISEFAAMEYQSEQGGSSSSQGSGEQSPSGQPAQKY